MARTPYIDKNGIKKGTWTAEEDMRLVAYVATYGCRNWRRLPKYAGLARCGKSCRLRWLNYLRPDIKRGNFTEEEEATIVALHESLGNKWSVIATHLPGRTDNEIKNYWNTHMSTKKSEPKPDPSVQPIACSSSSSDNVVSRGQAETISTSIGQIYDDNSTAHNETNVDQLIVSSSSPEDEQYCYLSLPQMSAESGFSLSPTTTGSSTTNAISSSSGSVVMNDHRHESDFGGDFWSQPFLVDQDDGCYGQGEIYSSGSTTSDGYYFGQLYEEDSDYLLWLHYSLHHELL